MAVIGRYKRILGDARISDDISNSTPGHPRISEDVRMPGYPRILVIAHQDIVGYCRISEDVREYQLT